MFFLKPKQKGILPPPPPESEDIPSFIPELPEKDKFFDEIIKPKIETFPEEKEFKNIVKNAGKKQVKAKKPKILKTPSPKKIDAKAIKKAKEPKAKKIQLKQNKKKNRVMPLIQPKERKLLLKEPGRKDLVGPEFDVPRDIISNGFDNLSHSGPGEIDEAKKEIEGAIDKIKHLERPSFLKGLFSKKAVPTMDRISQIQGNIAKSREALVKHDLQTAKSRYIEIIRIYKQMAPEDQAKVYQQIRDIYMERKDAEE